MPSQTEQNFDAACKWPPPIGAESNPRQSYGVRAISLFMAALNLPMLEELIPEGQRRRSDESIAELPVVAPKAPRGPTKEEIAAQRHKDEVCMCCVVWISVCMCVLICFRYLSSPESAMPPAAPHDVPVYFGRTAEEPPSCTVLQTGAPPFLRFPPTPDPLTHTTL